MLFIFPVISSHEWRFILKIIAPLVPEGVIIHLGKEDFFTV
ncbi:MAG: hypothetical protein SO116_01180 [Treponema sp.]|nr:hypothetical protein [Treponema sp.]